MLTIPDRTLVREGTPRGTLSILHLEAVRDRLAKIAEKQEPQDFVLPLKDLAVDFSTGRMQGQFDGKSDPPMLVSENGAQHLARDVLPSRFFSGLRELVKIDAEGKALASGAWRKFAHFRSDPRQLRTIKMKIGTEVHRVIRSCHSQDYATYSNLQFVQDILDNSPELSKLPVVDFRVTDLVMRLRFAELDGPTQFAMLAGEDAVLRSPVPMVEAWNSEVGCRKVGLRGGMWRLICLNCCGHWSDRTEYNWIHRGKPERIREKVKTAHTRLLQSAYAVVEAYNSASEVAIPGSLTDWVEDKLAAFEVPPVMIESVKRALLDPTTTQNASVASVVDAITLVAQMSYQDDPIAQYDMERIASAILSGYHASVNDQTEGGE